MKLSTYLLNAIRIKEGEIHDADIAVIFMGEDLDNLKEAYRQMRIKESRNGILEFVCGECGGFCFGSIAVDTEMILAELCPDCFSCLNNPARAKLARKIMENEQHDND